MGNQKKGIFFIDYCLWKLLFISILFRIYLEFISILFRIYWHSWQSELKQFFFLFFFLFWLGTHPFSHKTYIERQSEKNTSIFHTKATSWLYPSWLKLKVASCNQTGNVWSRDRTEKKNRRTVSVQWDLQVSRFIYIYILFFRITDWSPFLSAVFSISLPSRRELSPFC